MHNAGRVLREARHPRGGFAAAVAVLIMFALPHVASAATPQIEVGRRAAPTSPRRPATTCWAGSARDAVLAGPAHPPVRRAIVLERGGAEARAGRRGPQRDPRRLRHRRPPNGSKDRGFTEANIIVSASHTHAAPTGYYNFSHLQHGLHDASTRRPTSERHRHARSAALRASWSASSRSAIRRADDDLGPAKVGWGDAHLLGPHRKPQHRGAPARPRHRQGARPGQRRRWTRTATSHTIDPDVSVLRVDKIDRRRATCRSACGRRSPTTAPSTSSTFDVYNADHHGSATRVVEDAIRRAGRVPAAQDVVNVYGNTDEGDQSAGLDALRAGAAD